MARRIEAFTLMVLGFLLAILFRTAFLGFKSVWFDEAYSAWVAGMPPLDILAFTGRFDNHPPLYYLLLHFLVPDRFNEFYLRLPSAFFGALTIFFTYLLGRMVFGRKAGWCQPSY